MAGERRVQRHESGASPTLGQSRVTQSGTFAKALASPLGMLLVFPGVVLVVGVFLIWAAQSSLRASNLELAQTRMQDEARLVAEHLGSALAQSDAILSDLESFALTIDSHTPPERVAYPLRRMINGRPGASYISVSFPDGTFEGAFVDEDGVVRFQVSRVLESATEESVFDFEGGEQLKLREVRKSQYDPRTRPFYVLALRESGRVWTEPYAFARTGDTGITRTSAVRKAGAGEHAVLTIDFDVRRLSPLLVRSDARSERPVLFDQKGTILADPQVKLQEGEIKGPPRLLHYRTQEDPVLNGFFAARDSSSSGEFFSFSTERGPHLAATAHLAGKGRPDWSVAFIASEASFLSSLDAYKRKSFVLAASAVVLATILSSAFARLVIRVRKEARDAREAARLARKQARELGSYRLVEQLGVGGMGEVWRAEHRLLARQAAIKLIKNEGGPDALEAHKERFRREAQCLAGLRSRNTIEIFDYGVTDDGTFFYVMELLNGVDLETLVTKHGPQPPARVVNLLIQVCRSLSEAHAAGLVHRDVKPANIFVCRMADELDVVKVLDFGLVRSLNDEVPFQSADTKGQAPTSGLRETVPADKVASGASGPRLTMADSIMGTPDFMAPEQAVGSEVDARADIYAVGCVAFWLLTGRTVFQGKTVMAQLASHIAEIPPRLDEVSPHKLPQSLVELVATCLEKRPEDRPQSAALLRDALTRIQAELDVSWESEVQGFWDQHEQSPAALSLSPTVASGDRLAHTVALQRIS